MNPKNLQSLLAAIAAGEITPDQGFEQIKYLQFEEIEEFAKIDHHRQLRTGFPEVIWGQDKTVEQIYKIMQAMEHHGSIVMATRIGPEVYRQLKSLMRDLIYYPEARICALTPLNPPLPQIGKISIITAGTADLPVAEEAAITAELCGFKVVRLWDVGVAGIHRLLSNRELLRSAEVLIVVAGMEGALASVVAGMVDCPVIAVPTSIGYGASFGGIAPLLTMLNSCATGVGVVNIDNGFGAAMLAGQILRTAHKLSPQIP